LTWDEVLIKRCARSSTLIVKMVFEQFINRRIYKYNLLSFWVKIRCSFTCVVALGSIWMIIRPPFDPTLVLEPIVRRKVRPTPCVKSLPNKVDKQRVCVFFFEEGKLTHRNWYQEELNMRTWEKHTPRS